ncbi:gliding motility lipoprotein GldD [Bacteroidia bacterium]|nr:gliding motility lipoprotein GldD [Bacteroidia bacterium]
MKNKLLIICLTALFSCTENYVPKPRSFFRIALPEKEYRLFDERNYPFKYEYPAYAEIKPYSAEGEKYWHNILFPQLNAQINFSYLPVNDSNLSNYIADARTFVNRHQQKASAIYEKEYSYPQGKVYGYVFDIRGNNVASTYQFYLTDGTKHFVRGALYFMETPKNDSLQPVIDFLKEDIDYLIKSFEWK